MYYKPRLSLVINLYRSYYVPVDYAEATSDTYCGCGVAPNLAAETKHTHSIGRNMLGKLLETLRDTTLTSQIVTGDNTDTQRNVTDEDIIDSFSFKVKKKNEKTIVKEQLCRLSRESKSRLNSHEGSSSVPTQPKIQLSIDSYITTIHSLKPYAKKRKFVSGETASPPGVQ